MHSRLNRKRSCRTREVFSPPDGRATRIRSAQTSDCRSAVFRTAGQIQASELRGAAVLPRKRPCMVVFEWPTLLEISFSMKLAIVACPRSASLIYQWISGDHGQTLLPRGWDLKTPFARWTSSPSFDRPRFWVRLDQAYASLATICSACRRPGV